MAMPMPAIVQKSVALLMLALMARTGSHGDCVCRLV